MNIAIAHPTTSSLYELAANKFVTSLKTVNCNTETLDQLQIPKKCLVYRKISKMINEEVIFRDIQSRATIIKQFTDYRKRSNAIKEQSIKPGPAAFVLDSFYDDPDNELLMIVSVDHNFYDFVISPNFIHENKYFYRYISIKIIELHKNNIASELIIGLLNIIDTINILKVYMGKELDIIQNIVGIVKLIKAKKITDYFMLACFCSEIYESEKDANNNLPYEKFSTIYEQYFQFGLENDHWKTFSLPLRHKAAMENMQFFI